VILVFVPVDHFDTAKFISNLFIMAILQKHLSNIIQQINTWTDMWI